MIIIETAKLSKEEINNMSDNNILKSLIKLTKRFLFGYNIELPSKEWREKIHRVAEKGGSWEDFI